MPAIRYGGQMQRCDRKNVCDHTGVFASKTDRRPLAPTGTGVSHVPFLWERTRPRRGRDRRSKCTACDYAFADESAPTRPAIARAACRFRRASPTGIGVSHVPFLWERTRPRRGRDRRSKCTACDYAFADKSAPTRPAIARAACRFRRASAQRLRIPGRGPAGTSSLPADGCAC